MNELALFAGGGGGILGGKLLGWRTVCAVEFAAYPRSVLLARQRDGMLEPFPIWDDVSTFDGKPWRGHVDVVSGGFPCQDISSAGKGAGIGGARSGLWAEMARIICEVRPRYAFVENSPMLTSRGLWRVLGDLAAMGYDARWCVLGAVQTGAPHKRERIWIRAELANTCFNGRNPCRPCDAKESTGGRELGGGSISQNHVAHPDGTQRQGGRLSSGTQAEHTNFGQSGWWKTEPDVGRVANGVASGMDRLKATGNGQVPVVAALAWETLAP